MSTDIAADSFTVYKISAKSQSGGEPDEVANKWLRKWHLQPPSPEVASEKLYEHAVPETEYLGRLILMVWTETDTRRFMFILKNPGVGDSILEKGTVRNHMTAKGSSNQEQFMVTGNNLGTITFEGDPVHGIKFEPPLRVEIPAAAALLESPAHETEADLTTAQNASSETPVETSTKPVRLPKPQHKSKKANRTKLKRKEVMAESPFTVAELIDVVCKITGTSSKELAGGKKYKGENITVARKMYAVLAQETAQKKFQTMSDLARGIGMSNSGGIYANIKAGNLMKKSPHFRKLLKKAKKMIGLSGEKMLEPEEADQPTTALLPPIPAASLQKASASNGVITSDDILAYLLNEACIDSNQAASLLGMEHKQYCYTVGHTSVSLGSKKSRVTEVLRMIIAEAKKT